MESEPKSPSKQKLSISRFTSYKRVLRFCTIALAVVLFFVCVYVFEKGRACNAVSGSYYTVVVDCGSTGTRLNVYEWKSRCVKTDSLPVLVGAYPDNSTKSSLWKVSWWYHCLQTESGLDKFVGNASGVRASLEPLILWAEQLVPLERHGETPIFVLATAGLRRLTVEDARWVLEDIEAVVKEHLFVYKKNWIRVLSGKEEAYYGWVGLNYKLGSLGNSSRPTSGILDLGGSSLQVVMEDDGSKEDDDLIRSKIGLFEHRILAYSLPAFGLNAAFDRAVAMLSQAQKPKEDAGDILEIRHPCLSSGVLQNYSCNSCVGLNVADRDVSGQVKNTAITYTYLAGQPNWEECTRIARAVAVNASNLDWSQRTGVLKCKASLPSSDRRDLLNLTHVNHTTGRFHALSGFFAVYSRLNISSRANLTRILEQGQQLCSRSRVDLDKAAVNKMYNGHYCFQLPYMTSLIQEAVCLGDAEIIFGPADLSWTLGAALVEGKYLWQRSTRAQISFSLPRIRQLLSSPIFVFVFLLFLLAFVYYRQIKLPMPRKKAPAVIASLPSYIQPKRRPN